VIAVYCVLRSGGIYDADWVERLQRGVARNLKRKHRFVCLSDVEVPGERIPLWHHWPGWYSKIELFRPGVIEPPALYLDLDNVVVRNIDVLTRCPHDFAMLRNFNRPEYASSCVMWFGAEAPRQVYDRFVINPAYWMHYHETHRDGPYLGDQAFIWDALGREVEFLDLPRPILASYRKDIQPTGELPPETLMVAFGGSLKPNTVRHAWLKAAWI
jgi:hypothetical protein